MTNSKTLKSTPKYVAVYCDVVVYGPASKTDCKRFASGRKDLVVRKA